MFQQNYTRLSPLSHKILELKRSISQMRKGIKFEVFTQDHTTGYQQNSKENSCLLIPVLGGFFVTFMVQEAGGLQSMGTQLRTHTHIHTHNSLILLTSSRSKMIMHDNHI